MSGAGEEWRVVPGFDGWYEASPDGRVRSWKCTGVVGVRRAKPRILKGRYTELGYCLVKLTHPVFGAMDVGVHQLVLAAFVEPRPLYAVCDHINATPSDNRVENLRWLTAADNLRYAAALGRLCKRKGPRSHSLIDMEKAREIRARRAGGAALKALAQEFSVSVTAVSQIVNNLKWREVS